MVSELLNWLNKQYNYIENVLFNWERVVEEWIEATNSVKKVNDSQITFLLKSSNQLSFKMLINGVYHYYSSDLNLSESEKDKDNKFKNISFEDNETKYVAVINPTEEEF